MQNTKLISILKSFSFQEINHFAAWVASESYVGRKGNVKYVQKLLGYWPTFDDKELTKEKLWTSSYGDQPIAESQFKTEIKTLFDLAKQFLAFREWSKDPISMKLQEVKAIQSRGLPPLFRTESDALRRKLQQAAPADDQARFVQYELAQLANQDFVTAQQRTTDNNLQIMQDQLDKWYLVIKLRNACEMLNRQNILGTTPSLHLVEELLSASESPIYDDTPAIAAYRLVFRMLEDPTKAEAFGELKDLLFAKTDQFSKMEARALFKYAQNFCIGGINRGEKHFLRVLLQLYQYQLAQQIMPLGTFFPQTDYTNITTTALRLGEHDWALEFIEKYKEHINPTYSASAYLYSLASYHYHQKSYREAIQALNQSEFTDSFYGISARILLAKVYFENQEHEALSYHLAAFKRFLTRQKELSSKHQTPYLQFLRYLKRLNTLQERWAILSVKARTTQYQHIHESLSNADAVAHREWLLMQLGEFL